MSKNIGTIDFAPGSAIVEEKAGEENSMHEGKEKQGKKPVRIKDIARLSGVSATTVSNVIHGKPGKASPETLCRVQRILEECGYRPDMGAVMLAGNRARIVVLLLPGNLPDAGRQAQAYRALQRLVKGIDERGYAALLHFADRAEENLGFTAGWRAAGVLALGIGAEEKRKFSGEYGGIFFAAEGFGEREIEEAGERLFTFLT